MDGNGRYLKTVFITIRIIRSGCVRHAVRLCVESRFIQAQTPAVILKELIELLERKEINLVELCSERSVRATDKILYPFALTRWTHNFWAHSYCPTVQSYSYICPVIAYEILYANVGTQDCAYGFCVTLYSYWIFECSLHCRWKISNVFLMPKGCFVFVEYLASPMTQANKPRKCRRTNPGILFRFNEISTS